MKERFLFIDRGKMRTLLNTYSNHSFKSEKKIKHLFHKTSASVLEVPMLLLWPPLQRNLYLYFYNLNKLRYTLNGVQQVFIPKNSIFDCTGFLRKVNSTSFIISYFSLLQQYIRTSMFLKLW